jgi:hypothetical protein
MAIYKHANYFTKSNELTFDNQHLPGSPTPFSGVYRCLGCGREIVSEEHKPFPPQNHHQHTANQGPIRWRLIVFADHRPKAA